MLIEKTPSTSSLEKALQEIQEGFSLPASSVVEIADEFRRAMREGLYEGKGPLKMLPSFLGKPTGQEEGIYVAVDFGGTNIRVLIASLRGKEIEIIGEPVKLPIRDIDGGKYDLTSESVTGTELFDFVAQMVSQVVTSNESYYLGHTFSFPSRQENINTAFLITWTKEIKASGVVGEDVNKLLAQALVRKGLFGITPRAVLNDTVGTLLVESYSNPYADIGSICGTGHNTCYIEPNLGKERGPMIVNMESGNFNRSLPSTAYDKLIDQTSEKPGAQLLEKMVSGQYLGELFRLVICDLVSRGLLFTGILNEFPFKTGCVSSGCLSQLLSGQEYEVDRLLKNQWGISEWSADEISAMRTIASCIVNRAARLATATYLGVLKHIDPEIAEKHVIAVDGSIYEKTPGFAQAINDALEEVLLDKAKKITVKLTKDGSGIGAAIAAAMSLNIDS